MNLQQFSFLFFKEIQRERRELVRKIATTTTRRPRSGPRGNPGPGGPNNETRPSVQEDSEPFNPDNPYHVRTDVFMTAQMNPLNITLKWWLFLLEVSNEHLIFNLDFYSII